MQVLFLDVEEEKVEEEEEEKEEHIIRKNKAKDTNK